MTPESPLAPFLAELRKELAATRDDFQNWLITLATADPDDTSMLDAIEAYAGQVERIGQTAMMIGLVGLSGWCEQLLAALPNVVMQTPENRKAIVAHLAGWPDLMDQYLQAPAEIEVSLALAEHLFGPPWPMPHDDALSMAMVEALATPPIVPEELLGELADAAVPTEVSMSDVSLVLPDDADQDVYNAFLDEAPANINTFARLAARIAAGESGQEDLRNAKRIAHSFKGSANIVGIRGIAALGHHTEDVLEYFEQNSRTPPRPVANTLMLASDCLAQMVGYLRGDEHAPTNAYDVLCEVVHWANLVKSGEIEEIDFDQVDSSAPVAAHTFIVPISAPATEPDFSPAPAIEAIEAVATVAPAIEMAAPAFIAAATATSAPTAHSPAGIAPTPPTKNPVATPAEAEPQASLRVPVRTVDELHRLVGEMTSRIARLESQLANAGDGTRSLLAQNLVVQQRVLDIEKMVMLRGLSLTTGEGADEGALDPLEMDRYNELHGATRALVEVTSDADEMARDLESIIASVRTEVVHQTQINKDLQHQVVSTRLTPVSTLSARLTRNVRQTCQQTGKQAELEMIGGSILVDGDVLNKLADPLLHLLRNAVDHGIESPEVRVAAGKPPGGTVKLEFSRQGSSVIVHIRDDGRGLDFERIRAKAIDRGLIAGDKSRTHQELARLILLPGFSTRDAVNEISGRGIGMDVVASHLAELKGTVEVASVPGQGCDVTLRFQASMVSQHVLFVKSAGQTFAIPTHQIGEAVPAGFGGVEETTSLDDDVKSWRMAFRDRNIPVRDLEALTGQRSVELTAARAATMPAIVVNTPDGETAVLVESLIDSKEVMAKNLGMHLPRVHGVAGVTLLGDGTVVPLLNLFELLAAPIAITAAASQLAAAARKQARRVLVVDDSMSVRKSLVQLLEDAAYEVAVAGDGLEAIRAIDAFAPHVLCTDLEMPNMNGLELTEHLRLKDSTRELPIIMITSRSMDKHRQMATRAGVDYYVTKPYTDAELLRFVQEAYLKSQEAQEVMIP